MAKAIKAFTVSSRSKSRYDWDSWLDGRVWSLVYGDDYEVEISAFRSCASIAAKKRGVSVTVRQVAGGVEIQAIKKS